MYIAAGAEYSGDITFEGGVLYNCALFNTEPGIITSGLSTGSVIHNYGRIDFSGGALNLITINNYASGTLVRTIPLTMQSNATIVNYGELQFSAAMAMNTTSRLDNYDTWQMTAAFTADAGSIINNFFGGTINFGFDLETSATFLNEATINVGQDFNNNGPFDLNGGCLNITDNIDNNGTITGMTCGTISNNAYSNNSGTITGNIAITDNAIFPFVDDNFGVIGSEVRGISCGCPGPGPEICYDGIDNDGDGLIDCEDPDCAAFDYDGDLICDYMDLDDDNDGIPDEDECNYTVASIDFTATLSKLAGTGNAHTGEFGSAPGGVEGDVYLYNNALTLDGVNYDVIVEIIRIEYDDDANDRIAIMTSSSHEGYVRIDGGEASDDEYVTVRYDIVVDGSATSGTPLGTPVSFDKMEVNMFDIDSDIFDNYTEVLGLGDTKRTNIEFASTTNLEFNGFETIVDPSGFEFSRMRKNVSGSAANWTNESNSVETDTKHAVYSTYNNTSEFTLLIGVTGATNNLNIRGPYYDVKVYSCIDTDNDGVPNDKDLDSDNDGIYDVVEADHGESQTDGQVTGTVGDNGLLDALEFTADDGVLDYVIADSESAPDGIYDFIEINADGDGCNDTEEQSISDPDFDGIAGTGTPTVSSTGLVSGATYTVPVNTNWQNPGVLFCSENCSDGLDNDGDGLIDCADPDCDAYDPDNDGICNEDDLDDDNDGIPDVIECDPTAVDLDFSVTVTRIAGTGNAEDGESSGSGDVGDIYLYDNALTINGVDYDFIMEIVQLENDGASGEDLYIIDSGPYKGFFSVTGTDPSQDEYVIVRYDIVEDGSATAATPSGTPVSFEAIDVTALDIDSHYTLDFRTRACKKKCCRFSL